MFYVMPMFCKYLALKTGVTLNMHFISFNRFRIKVKQVHIEE